MAKIGSRGSLFNLMGLKHKTVEINHSRILNLYSESVELVKATEILNYQRNPRNLPIPVFCRVFAVSGGAPPYGNQSAEQHLMLILGNGDLSLARSVMEFTSPGNPDVSYRQMFVPPRDGDIHMAAAFPMTAAQIGTSFKNLENNALSLGFMSPNHDLTGGHSDDKLIVFLTYYVAKLN
jgi:hypothetical protein